MKESPIKPKPLHNCFVLGQDAYMNLGSRHFSHNFNLAVIGAEKGQFQALVNANLRQGACNYVILTSSESAYNKVSSVLSNQGYNIYAYDLNANNNEQESPACLLSRSLATAIFFLFDRSSQISRQNANNILDMTFHCLCSVRSHMQGTERPPHIQFFLDDFDLLPPIPLLTRALAAARSCKLGIAFSCSSQESLRKMYPNAFQEILDCCDLHLFYGCSIPKPRLFSFGYLRSLLQKESVSQPCCELHVKGYPPMTVIPFGKE